MTAPYQLMGPRGAYRSETPGLLGGYRPKKIFGSLECASAKRAIEKGGYVQHRVFFADEATAKACGFRPCAKCMPTAYLEWKQAQQAATLEIAATPTTNVISHAPATSPRRMRR